MSGYSPSLIAPPSAGAFVHPALGPVFYSLREVSDDPDTQVAQVIGMMSGYANQDARSPLFQPDLIMCGSGDPISDVWNYLSRFSGSRGMQFVSDETAGAMFDQSYRWRPLVEALIRPVDQAHLPNPQGDCDDFAMYGAAHLIARGVPCSYATVAADIEDPNVYSHVYLVAYPNGQRVPMDLSHGAYPGWECPNPFGKFREWPINHGCNPLLMALVILGPMGWLLYKAMVN